jgi:glycosyltransferase involved in cell wall biosynthesis
LNKKIIVVSGINMTNSGLLSIMTDCLKELSEYSKNRNIEIIALVHKKSLFSIPNITYFEFPKSKKSWMYRLYYEFIYFRTLSKKLKPDLWFSMHDLSPRVLCPKKYVYCHNPSPFYQPSIKDWRFGFKISLFALFYKYAYQINIKSNTAVFVQQNWIKTTFEKWYGITNCRVAHPETKVSKTSWKIELDSSKIHFFYPTSPRMFKNLELIFESILRLPNELKEKVQFHVTFSGTENAYARFLYEKYNRHGQFKFIGTIPRVQISGYYQAMDALLFSSKIETWGLPITESKEFSQPIFVSDLPYAHETIGNYDRVCFFDTKNSEDLTRKLTSFIEGKNPFITTNVPTESEADFIGWESVFNYIFTD